MQNPEKWYFFSGWAGEWEENWILKMVKFILNTEFQPSMVTLEYIRSHGKEKKKPAKFSKLAGKRASIRNNSF